MNWLLKPLIGLPRWAQGVGVAALLVLGFMVWLHFHDRGVIREHEAKISKLVEEKKALAAQVAAKAAQEVRDDTSDAVKRSNEAAAVSDDPLVAGRGELR